MIKVDYVKRFWSFRAERKRVRAARSKLKMTKMEENFQLGMVAHLCNPATRKLGPGMA